MSILNQLLTQFLLRLSFGLALGMSVTSPRQVTSGYFRNHAYVLLGLMALATTVAAASGGQFSIAAPLVAAIASYASSVCWLYEKPRAGIVTLAVVAAAALVGMWSDTHWPTDSSSAAWAFAALDPLTSGLVLGLTMAAMFLGHWYLNSPTMALGPLDRLIVLMAGAIVLRTLVEAGGLTIALSQPEAERTVPWTFVVLRWLSGIVGAFALTLMARATLRVPNTQSATGILYVAVIVTFLGELASILLVQQSGAM